MQSASGHPFVDVVTNPTSTQGVILSQGTHVLDGGFWPYGILPDMNETRIDAEASSLVQQSRHLSSVSLTTNTDVQAYFTGPYPSTPSSLFPGIDKFEQAGTPYPERLIADICDEDFPATPSSDSMSLTSFSGFSLVCCLSIRLSTLI